jgi:P4 family phage/plasmid primase-like protien
LQHQLGVRHGQAAFRNLPVASARSAATRAVQLSEEGADTYFACSEYGNSTNRRADNVVSASAFWFDLDCGTGKAATGKGYDNTDEAYAALHQFCDLTGIPAPTHVVNSGGGLHAYLAVDLPIAREVWQVHANKLKALAKACTFLADPTRTADIASVLRIPGTLNHKYTPPMSVRLLTAERALGRDGVLQAIDKAHERLCGALPPVRPLQEHAANDAILNVAAETPSSYGPPDLVKLASALKVLDPDCDDGTWKLHRLAPMARTAREHPAHADQLLALARSWSSGELRGAACAAWKTPGTSNGVTGAVEFDRAWSRFLRDGYSGQSTSLGTIYHDAAQVGWTDPTDAFEVVDTPAPVDAREHLLEQARETIDAMVAKVKAGDVGAPLEPENVAALTLLRQESEADYQRARDQLKAANKRVLISAVDAAVKAGVARTQTPQTHHGYAADLIARLTVNGWHPLAHEGTLFAVEPERNIWVARPEGELVKLIAEAHDGKDNCTRCSDYKGVAQHATALAIRDGFFASAPAGVACPDGFYLIAEGDAKVEALTPAHRQRVLLPFSPRKQSTPLFDAFLHETFESGHEGEEAEQVALVQEIAGAVMLGLMPRFQKAVLCYEAYGRAGKGTIVYIISQLVPKEFAAAISPFNWDKEYYLATLAGVRLNVVGELPENEPIPAASFKSVLGGDLLTGRNPAQKPISFRNEAAHLFMSNHMINSRDQSEAFFGRWLVLDFPNSRLRTGKPLDPTLAQRIVDNELPGIAHWALEGAKRLLRNNAFSQSAAHDRLMAQWRRGNSSLEQFIHECCEMGAEHHVRRSKLYERYKEWCGDNGRKPFAKGTVKDLLDHNVALGVTSAGLHGYEIFRGLRLKIDEDGYDLSL